MPPENFEVDPDLLAWAEGLRRDLHRHPELAFGEHRTAGAIARELKAMGLSAVRTGVAGTGVVGWLPGARPGRAVGLRADMDALAIPEASGVPYASENPGCMHACGHDGHMAILLGVARLLTTRRSDWAGGVKFIFQPAEEEGAGGHRMVEAGVLRDPPIEAIFALHGQPGLPVGAIELAEVMSAATNPFDICIRGQGCHGAYPHKGCDPIVIGCQVVCALQSITSRQVAPDEPVVVTIGSFQSGAQRNVIPDEARLQGTIRTRDPTVQKKVCASVERIVHGVCAALGGQAQVTFLEGYPRVKNDPHLLRLVEQLGIGLLGRDNVRWSQEKTMGGEDFSFYLEEQGGVPGCLFRLGVGGEAPLHSARFDFGATALAPGIRMLTNLALNCLEERNPSAPPTT